MKPTFMQECYDKYVTEEIKERIMKREEEIKKAAEYAYAHISELAAKGKLDGTFTKIFALGAEWADEHPQFVHTDNSQVIVNLEAEIERLKNPWISVEDRLPECKWDGRVSKNHSDYCAILQADGSMYVAQYYCDFEAWSETPYMCEWLRNITHWMPIPELKKGGEK